VNLMSRIVVGTLLTRKSDLYMPKLEAI